MLLSTTAQPGRSVWDWIGRKTFEYDLDRLHHTKFVLESHTLYEQDWLKLQREEALPFAIEKLLSDDVAFVSAYEYGV
jgi:LPS sulfotransferase NodH